MAVQHEVLPLARARSGQELRVCRVQGGAQTQRLRELGVIEGRMVRIVTDSDPFICQVGDCRFGMCRRLARCIMVEPVAPSAAHR